MKLKGYFKRSARRSTPRAVIACPEGSFDLRPIVNVLEADIENALATTDGNIIVLMGEEHKTSAHILMQKLLLARLHKKGIPFAFGFEYPHNALDTTLKALANSWPDDLGPADLSQADQDGEATLKTMLAFTIDTMAPDTRASLMGFCLKNNISTRFNDAACDDDGNLTPENIDPKSPAGMAVRNIKMVANAKAHMRAKSVRLYIQHCGNKHIFGCTEKRYAYSTSLYSLFSQTEGATVIAFKPTAGPLKLNTLPKPAHTRLGQTILAHGFFNGQYTDKGYRGHETRAIETFQKHSGHEFPIFDREEELDTLKASVNAEAQSWADRARIHRQKLTA